MADRKAARPPLVLVDGSSYLYRAFHALPALTTSTGRHTGAVRGVTAMLRRLLADYPDSVIAVVFDAKGKTFRDEIFADYKANRPPMPDELREQVEPIHDIVRAMGLPLLVVDGVEADDVIGTLATRAAADGQQVVISTGDKDMAQLVTADITLINTMTETVLDPQGVENKLGVPPARVVDLLALMGDKIDNIPGVKGVGEKTAVALISHLGGIDDLYARLDAVAEVPVRGAKSLGAKLDAAREDAFLSRQLATIRTDLELPLKIGDLAPPEVDAQALRELFRALEFRSWLDELQREGEDGVAPAAEEPVEVAARYETILDRERFEAWVERLREAPLICIDTETTSLRYMDARLVGFSFSVEPGEAAYLPLGHDYMGAPPQLDFDEALAALKPILESPEHAKLGQNLKYDMSVLANHDITLRGVRHDTMLESYVLDATATRHDMDSLALKYLGHSTIHFEDIAGKGAKQLTFNEIAIEEAGPYAAEDADVTLRLHQALWPRLAAEQGPRFVFEEIEMPLVPVLSRIERTGAPLDCALLRRHSGELAARLEEVEARAHELAGRAFNLGSPKQLQEILFEEQELPVLRKTPKGQPSTAEPVLQELAADYELPRVIMDYRELSKLKSTYTDKLPEQVNPHTGRVHTSYHQAVAATGRLSSSDPNLQNIPVRTAEGRRIRQAFAAPAGRRIVAADYSQIELRIMAHLSGDAGLRGAFDEGLDVHRATAAEVFGVELDAVSSEQRRRAKAINFGLIYGMSAFGLSRQLQIERGEAQEYMARYFERYPGVRDFMDGVRAGAVDRGYVETIFGRRLYLPDLKARNAQHRQAAERTAINAPMQGSAADIIKRAMIHVDAWLQDAPLDAQMIMQVHDELVFEVAEGDVEALCAEVPRLMATAADLDVELVVDVGIGANWDEAH
jgi:DNA polymerase-1